MASRTIGNMCLDRRRGAAPNGARHLSTILSQRLRAGLTSRRASGADHRSCELHRSPMKPGLDADIDIFASFRAHSRPSAARPHSTIKFKFDHQQQTPRLSAGHHVVHLPRLSRYGAAAAYVYQDWGSHGGDFCLRQHAAQAACGLSAGASGCCL